MTTTDAKIIKRKETFSFNLLKGFYLTIVCLIILIAFTSAIPLQTEVLAYDINLNGKKIGHLILHRKSVNSGLHYSFTSQVDYRFIKHFDIRFNIQSYFSEGNLVASSSIHQVNGETKSNCEVKKEEKGYGVKMDGTTYQLSTSDIKYSLTTLYFHEPVKVQQVFSERYAKFLPIKLVEPHRYVMIMPDGGKNYYQFSDGICKEVDVNITFGELQFRLQTN